jgi:crotonobetainyl-CoA:carnitine CoA-transferase CaiB-like acyl-CoA transferase
LVRTRSAAEWESIAIEIGSPFAQVRSPQEWLVNDHARASGAVVSVDDPEYGALDLCGPCIQAEGSPLVVSARSLPDADRDGILTSHRQARRVSARKPGLAAERPLDGVAVVELSQVVAGPVAGRLLADYGADVLKVANPSPSGNNGFHGSFTNRGKSTVFVDVQDEGERRRLRSAIRDADVLLQNYAHGAVERYGLGYGALRTVRPGLVYVSLSAFGQAGPWQHRRGHENQAVAATGLSARYGGAAGWPRYQPYLVSDVGTGIVGAIAAALGLYRRAQTGTGQHLSSSLAHVATLHQALYLFGTDRPAARLPEPTGTEARGWNALQRLYEVADGWIFLAALPSKVRQVADAVGLPTTEVDPDLDEDGPFAAALSARLVERTAAEWMQVLAPLDVAVQAVREIAAVAHDPCWHRRGILRYARNGEGQDAAPVLGAGPQPWPLPARSLRHPGPLGSGATEPRATDSTGITMHHSNRHTDRPLQSKGTSQ